MQIQATEDTLPTISEIAVPDLSDSEWQVLQSAFLKNADLVFPSDDPSTLQPERLSER